MTGASELELIIRNLLEKEPWGIEVTIGTRLSMEFGVEMLRPKHKQAHGEWHLLFQDCHWRIENAESVLVGSDDENLATAIRGVNFDKIINIRLVPPSRDLEIIFENGLRLTTFLTFSNTCSESKQWYLFCPDESVLIAEGGGDLSLKDRNGS